MKTFEISRRRFLQGSGALVGALTLGGLTRPGPVSAAEDFQGYPDRFGMLTDTTKCLGCRLCEAACNKANGLPPPAAAFSDQKVFEQKRRTTAGVLTVVNRYRGIGAGAPSIFRKIQCMHCNEPACVSACLVGALKKTPEGPVLYDESFCIGCRYCMNACPYTGLAYEYNDPLTPAVTKCTMCYKRIKDGGTPACAEACPTKATMFGKRADLLEIAHDRIRQSTDKYVPQVFGEHEAGGAGWLYLSSVPFQQLDLPADMGATPYPEFTRDWLLGVPLVLILWPTLLMGIRHFNQQRGDNGAAIVTAEQEVKK